MWLTAGTVAVTGLLAIAGAPEGPRAAGNPYASKTGVSGATLIIPKSVQTEHEAIHAHLVEATKAGGRVGTAATQLAEVLHPHFVREEQIALPPLGLLARLAAGAQITAAESADALSMTDSLRRELPRMLEEHKRIRQAVEGLRAAAVAERASKAQELAADLALHAQTEEEVLYPAAVLVGDLVRARPKGK